jgi:hypothetical protein
MDFISAHMSEKKKHEFGLKLSIDFDYTNDTSVLNMGFQFFIIDF